MPKEHNTLSLEQIIHTIRFPNFLFHCYDIVAAATSHYEICKNLTILFR